MSIRVYVQLDHTSESMRFVARAEKDGALLHEVGKYGGSEARDEVFRKMTVWLKSHGYPVPDHYWQQTFPH